MVKLVALNLLALACIGGPLLVLEFYVDKVNWLEEHKDIVRIFVWCLCTILGYFVVLPALGLELKVNEYER